MTWNQPPTTLLSPKTVQRIGIWNVRTLYETGRAAQVASEMERYKLDILGLSETRWTTAGRVVLATSQTVLYSGPPNENDHHRNGVALMLSQKASKSLLEWEPVNERIITARFQSKFQKVTILQCYAPTNQADQQDKEDFYGQLQNTLDNVPRRDITIIMGDMNAKVGSINTGRELIMGKEGLGTMNENGELFSDFCAQNDLVIGGTIFSHKRINKATWKSPDGTTENQIDHVTISRRWRRTLQDVRVCRGADVASDHELVIIKLRVKIARAKKTNESKSPHYDTSKLKLREECVNIAGSISNKFQALLEDGLIEQKWHRVRTAFTSACDEVLGKQRRNYKSWLSEPTIKKIEQRKEIKQRINQARTRAQKQRFQQQYSEKQKEVKKRCRQDKTDYIDNLAVSAEEAAVRGDMKTLYDLTKKLVGRKVETNKPVKGRDGRVLTKPDEQLERWKEHFSSLLNGAQVEDPPDIPAGEELNINTDPITVEEIKVALTKIKSGKAPGPDNIPPEALKADPDTTAKVMIDLLQSIWETEDIPEEWKKGLIVKLPKKGDLSDVQNWRGIQLLSLPSKVLTRIILKRIMTAIDKSLREEQAGFRAGRSCTDQIATLRIIIEQTVEWQSPLYVNFIDYRKAFDMVDRPTIWKILRHYGLPAKIINIIRSMYEGTICQVIHNSDLSPSFAVTTGVRQGCLLSPTIFLLVIDWIMKTITATPRGIQWTVTKKLEDLDFADDIALLSHSFQHIQQKTDILRNTAKSTGLDINVQKTKCLRVNAAQNSPIMLDGEPVENVSKFTYLGSILSETGGSDEDIRARIGKARHAFVTLKPVWRNRNIRLNTKLRLFNSNVKTVLLYGCETWRHTKALDQKLQVCINNCLRQILRIRWPEKISNQELWRRTHQRPIAATIKDRKWRWIGHTLRRDQPNIARQALDWNPQGKRRRGRPRQTWRRTLDTELRTTNMTWGEAIHAAQDRIRWRDVVKALCPDVGEEE